MFFLSKGHKIKNIYSPLKLMLKEANWYKHKLNSSQLDLHAIGLNPGGNISGTMPALTKQFI